jgi:hypothetical protein
MKRMLSVLAAAFIGALLLSAHALHAGGKSFSIRGGYFAPEGANAGFSLGGSVGTQFDEMVGLGIGTDIFWKNYTKSTVISKENLPSGLTPQKETVPIAYNTIIVPLMLELMIRIPIVSSFGAFAHGGLGYEFLFNGERNYYTGEKDNRFYSGFTWQIGGGVMVNLGSQSSIFVEGYYDHGKPRRNLKEFIAGAPVFESVNLSGFGIRAGLSLGPL